MLRLKRASDESGSSESARSNPMNCAMPTAPTSSMATPIGTPTNMTLLGVWSESPLLPGEGPSVGEWFLVAAPFCVMMLITSFVVLTARLAGSSDGVPRDFFTQRLRDLGPISGGGRMVVTIFVLTAAAWMTRKRIEFGDLTLWPGWEPAAVSGLSQLGIDARGMIADATVAGAAALSLFILPGRRTDGTVRPLLRWEEAERSVPWGVLLLFGGGFTIAAAFDATGLSAWTGEVTRQALDGSSETVVIGGAAALVTVLTEFTTNVATISTLLPALLAMSESLSIEPALVAVPATLAASCAFMLPIATPPNAVVYGSGRVPLRRMVASGILLNVASVALLTLVSAVAVRFFLL